MTMQAVEAWQFEVAWQVVKLDEDHSKKKGKKHNLFPGRQVCPSIGYK
jgi:hypothetical protein